jgi:hypothetical protein
VVPRWPDDGADLWPRDRSTHRPIENVHEVLAQALV